METPVQTHRVFFMSVQKSHCMSVKQLHTVAADAEGRVNDPPILT